MGLPCVLEHHSDLFSHPIFPLLSFSNRIALLLVDCNGFFIAFQVLKLDSHVVVGYCKDEETFCWNLSGCEDFFLEKGD
jgi:hypothetical protein